MTIKDALTLAAEKIFPKFTADEITVLVSRVIDEHRLDGVHYCKVVTKQLVKSWVDALRKEANDPFEALTLALEEIGNCLLDSNDDLVRPEEECPYPSCDALAFLQS